MQVCNVVLVDGEFIKAVDARLNLDIVRRHVRDAAGRGDRRMIPPVGGRHRCADRARDAEQG